MTIEINDLVLIKPLGLEGVVIGRSLQEHNKAKVGDFSVAYWTTIRGQETRVTDYFSPDDLEMVKCPHCSRPMTRAEREM